MIEVINLVDWIVKKAWGPGDEQFTQPSAIQDDDQLVIASLSPWVESGDQSTRGEA